MTTPTITGATADMLTDVRLLAAELGWTGLIDAPSNGNVGHWARGNCELVVAFTRRGTIAWAYIDEYAGVDVADTYLRGKLQAARRVAMVHGSPTTPACTLLRTMCMVHEHSI
ncbi:hypothetical protein I5G67_gp078 [Mycobacterium phage Aminay]|uniref:Uncharacterized protein n=1 Tax=Mycobacterium phage Aminay TaxID=2250291 RepID=A0A345KV62_9CAUD|nr:hypothetical protein I5G67_gp078 [Mycobacterium phage Aminay]AXH46914.1 hypothetical protein SEA_AMINAY_78 [Mycobacterium phage Aminay]